MDHNDKIHICKDKDTPSQHQGARGDECQLLWPMFGPKSGVRTHTNTTAKSQQATYVLRLCEEEITPKYSVFFIKGKWKTETKAVFAHNFLTILT